MLFSLDFYFSISSAISGLIEDIFPKGSLNYGDNNPLNNPPYNSID